MNLEEKLYTSTEVAQILGVSLRSVYRYLDEGKLDAEVKTATGRHRFTKKNILDFLYPNGEKSPEPVKTSSTGFQQESRVGTFSEPRRTSTKFSEEDDIVAPAKRSSFGEGSFAQSPAAGQKGNLNNISNEEENRGRFEIEDKFTSPKVETKVETEENDDSEPIDWLAKFREAAKKFREEEEKQTPAKEPVREYEATIPTPTPVATPSANRSHVEAFTSINSGGFDRQKEVVEQAPKVKGDKEFYFYRSMIGGLKDIAQNIDKNARKSGLNYAFTRSAGLSLHKPIRPFSLLHSYVSADDKEFFERALHLVPSDENNAQLCLIVTDNRGIFNSKKEMHNLFVVSDSQLRKDLSEAGDDDLVVELDSVLGF